MHIRIHTSDNAYGHATAIWRRGPQATPSAKKCAHGQSQAKCYSNIFDLSSGLAGDSFRHIHTYINTNNLQSTDQEKLHRSNYAS